MDKFIENISCLVYKSGYKLEIYLVPSAYNLDEVCHALDSRKYLICIENKDLGVKEGFAGVFSLCSRMLKISFSESKGYYLWGDSLVCHNVFIVDVVKLKQ